MFEAERPLECSECKKDDLVYYTKIKDGVINHFKICDSCQLLNEWLYGKQSECSSKKNKGNKSIYKSCEKCNTSLRDLLKGGNIGCENCYRVFEDFIERDLYEKKLLKGNDLKKKFIHNGSKPGDKDIISHEAQLAVLKESLAQALAIEDYEEAIWIRDQIEKIESSKRK